MTPSLNQIEKNLHLTEMRMIITTNKIPRKEPTQIKTTGTGETVLAVLAGEVGEEGEAVVVSSSGIFPEQEKFKYYL